MQKIWKNANICHLLIVSDRFLHDKLCFSLSRASGPACRKPLPEPTARAEVQRRYDQIISWTRRLKWLKIAETKWDCRGYSEHCRGVLKCSKFGILNGQIPHCAGRRHDSPWIGDPWKLRRLGDSTSFGGCWRQGSMALRIPQINWVPIAGLVWPNGSDR